MVDLGRHVDVGTVGSGTSWNVRILVRIVRQIVWSFRQSFVSLGFVYERSLTPDGWTPTVTVTTRGWGGRHLHDTWVYVVSPRGFSLTDLGDDDGDHGYVPRVLGLLVGWVTGGDGDGLLDGEVHHPDGVWTYTDGPLVSDRTGYRSKGRFKKVSEVFVDVRFIYSLTICGHYN